MKEAQAFATLDTLLQMARELADGLESTDCPSHTELVAAIATSQLCALRLMVERDMAIPEEAPHSVSVGSSS